MKNLFENAKFGDKFLTKDGRMAVLVNWDGMMQHAFLYVKERDIEFYGEEMYNLDGTTARGSTLHDIVSRWNDSIDIEELDRFADEYSFYNPDPDTTYKCQIEAFKAGYRQALNNI